MRCTRHLSYQSCCAPYCSPAKLRGESAATASLFLPRRSLPRPLLPRLRREARSEVQRGNLCNKKPRSCNKEMRSSAVGRLRAIGVASGARTGARLVQNTGQRPFAVSLARADSRLQPQTFAWTALHRFAGLAVHRSTVDGRRMLSEDANKDVREAKAFLLRLRYSPEVADGVITALKSSGALLPTLYAMAGNWVRAPLTRRVFWFDSLALPCTLLSHCILLQCREAY